MHKEKEPSVPNVPAFTSAWSPATVSRQSLWLMIVPLDGRPKLEEFRKLTEVNTALAALVDKGETGWVYLVEGVRHTLNFSDAPTLKLGGVDHLLEEIQETSDDLLPGTELYP